MMPIRYVVLPILLIPVILANAQDRRSLPDVSLTFKGTLVLPVPLNNPLFDDITETIGQLDGVIQYPLYKGLGVGVGGKMTWFGIKERALAPVVTGGDIRRGTYFGKIQYERYTGDRTFYEFSAKLGSSTYVYECGTCPDDNTESGFHWGLGVGYYVHVSDNLAFGFTLGYETDGVNFDVSDIGLESVPGRAEKSDAANYQNLLIGMGFSTRFRRSREGPAPW